MIWQRKEKLLGVVVRINQMQTAQLGRRKETRTRGLKAGKLTSALPQHTYNTLAPRLALLRQRTVTFIDVQRKKVCAWKCFAAARRRFDRAALRRQRRVAWRRRWQRCRTSKRVLRKVMRLKCRVRIKVQRRCVWWQVACGHVRRWRVGNEAPFGHLWRSAQANVPSSEHA